MVQWADFPIGGRLWLAGDETLTQKAMPMLENVLANDAGSYSRFPGLERFASFPGNRTYLRAYRDELYAGTDQGRLYKISPTGRVIDVTGVPISGGGRWTFTTTDDALLMAAGGPIVQLAGNETKVLSTAAPPTTHVAYIDGYTLALEANSNRFQHSAPGSPAEWDPQDVFSANAVAETANFLLVTPYREILVGGSLHIEQWETIANGVQALSRRFNTGQGCAYPHTLISDATGTYGVNNRAEFVRFAGQISQEQSEDVALALSKVDDWTDAWGCEASMFGQRLMILSMPQATNPHGTKGLTFCFDYRAKKFTLLYGPTRLGVPTAWPVWSVTRCYNKTFGGIAGGVAVFSDENYEALGEEMRSLVRTPHVSEFGPSRIDNMRIRLKRGEGLPDRPLRRETAVRYGRETYRPLLREAGPPQEAMVAVRCNRDNQGWDDWQIESLGDHGDNFMWAEFGAQGSASTWQFEIQVTDAVPLELTKMQIHVERLRW